MTDLELFEETLNRIAEENKLTIKRPYGDNYIQLYDSDTLLGGFNYSDFPLAYNIHRLGEALGVFYK